MFYKTMLMLALLTPAALADTGIEDTGLTDTGIEDTGLTDTGIGDTSTPTSGVGIDNPNVLDDDDTTNTGSGGSPMGLGTSDGCGGSMALLLLPILFGWRSRGSQPEA